MAQSNEGKVPSHIPGSSFPDLRATNVFELSRNKNLIPNNTVMASREYNISETPYSNVPPEHVPMHINAQEVEGHITRYSQRMNSLHLFDQNTPRDCSKPPPLLSCRVCGLMVANRQHKAHETGCYAHHSTLKTRMKLKPSLDLAANNPDSVPISTPNYSASHIEDAACAVDSTSYGWKNESNVLPVFANKDDAHTDSMAYAPHKWNDEMPAIDILPPINEEPLVQQTASNYATENVQSGNYDIPFQDVGGGPVSGTSYAGEKKAKVHFISFMKNVRNTSAVNRMVYKKSNFDLKTAVPLTTTTTTTTTTTEDLNYIQNGVGFQTDITPTTLCDPKNILNCDSVNSLLNESSLFTNPLPMIPGSNTDAKINNLGGITLLDIAKKSSTDRIPFYSANDSCKTPRSTNLEESQTFADRAENFYGFKPVDKVRDWASLTFGNHTIMEDLACTRLTKKDKIDEVPVSPVTSGVVHPWQPTKSEVNNILPLPKAKCESKSKQNYTSQKSYIPKIGNSNKEVEINTVSGSSKIIIGDNFNMDQKANENSNFQKRYGSSKPVSPCNAEHSTEKLGNGEKIKSNNVVNVHAPEGNGSYVWLPCEFCYELFTSVDLLDHQASCFSTDPVLELKNFPTLDESQSAKSAKYLEDSKSVSTDIKPGTLAKTEKDNKRFDGTTRRNDSNYSPPPDTRHNDRNYLPPPTWQSGQKYSSWQSIQTYSSAWHNSQNNLSQSNHRAAQRKYPYELEYFEQQSPRDRRVTLKDVMEATPIPKTRNRKKKAKVSCIESKKVTSSAVESESTQIQTEDTGHDGDSN